MKILILLISIFLITACSEEERKPYYITEDEKPVIRQMILDVEPELGDLDGFELVIALRDFAHRKVKLQRMNDEYLVNSATYNMERILNGDDWGHYCGGIAQSYMDMLASFGISSRMIQMIAESGGYDTHVAVEALVNGQWIAVDPTFNVSFSVNGKLIDYTEMFNRKFNGVSFENNNYQPLDGRYVGNYYLPYDELMYEVWLFSVYPGSNEVSQILK